MAITKGLHVLEPIPEKRDEWLEKYPPESYGWNEEKTMLVAHIDHAFTNPNIEICLKTWRGNVFYLHDIQAIYPYEPKNKYA